MSQEFRIEILKDRALMLKKAREFFYERAILEVDCPILSPYASVDAHIDLIAACAMQMDAFLHSSPEYPMKRLLSEGIGDIFQLSHVFRDGECGSKHNPEFMMAEWYRLSFSFEAMVEETLDFIRLFLGNFEAEIVSYKELFLRYAGIDPYSSTNEELGQYLQKISPETQTDSRDDILNFILALQIEPQLGKNKLTALVYYPPTQAALAKTRLVDGEMVAERFEIYYQGTELANGYHELQDADEQLRRLIEANELRLRLGKNELPIDMRFIEALKHGLPACSGVAVGFDRLMMLRHNKQVLSSILSFDWDSI